MSQRTAGRRLWWCGLVMLICGSSSVLLQLIKPGRFFYPLTISSAGVAIGGLIYMIWAPRFAPRSSDD